MNNNKPVDNLKPKEKAWRPNSKLTSKQNAFIKHIVDHPKENMTDAAVASYNGKDRHVAANIARNLQKKPHIMAELAKYSSNAEANLVKLANATTEYALGGGKDGAAYAGVAERVNNSILDRLHGKATQRVEANSIAVTLNVDLSAAAV